MHVSGRIVAGPRSCRKGYIDDKRRKVERNQKKRRPKRAATRWLRGPDNRYDGHDYCQRDHNGNGVVDVYASSYDLDRVAAGEHVENHHVEAAERKDDRRARDRLIDAESARQLRIEDFESIVSVQNAKNCHDDREFNQQIPQLGLIVGLCGANGQDGDSSQQDRRRNFASHGDENTHQPTQNLSSAARGATGMQGEVRCGRH